ncbi:hypothetical protein [Janthinobacterium sp. RB2P8]|uniref:hypothetical protein n=1 Tax=Janthinobacterium sp. RB2P8 TaxID=3424191 RepID=UPI003F279FB6
MKSVLKLLARIWRYFMSYGSFQFEGKNVVQGLEYVQSVHATVKGSIIEILTTDGTTATVPNTIINIGQLVGYCYVSEVKTSDDLEVIEFEIEESKEKELERAAWRKSKGLDSNSSSYKLK